MAPTNGTPTPIATIEMPKWPRVTVGNQTLEVKDGILASVTLAEWGIDRGEVIKSLFEFVPAAPVKEIVDGVEVEKTQNVAKDPNYQLRMCQMFAAMVAHNYLAMGAQPETPIEWALKIDDANGFLPFADPNCCWQQVRNAVYEALGKRALATKTTTPPLPAIPEPETPVLQ